MKTFEERYTAWIDGQLAGPALAAFEQELARRSAAGEIEADRTDTLRLRHLLRDHLEAPTLNNAEFFSHQLRERINAERASTARRPEGAAALRGGFPALFPWPLLRVAGLGAACLFVAGALYYGLEPGATAPKGADKVARATPATANTSRTAVAATDSPASAAAPAPDRSGPTQLVLLSTPIPAPDDAPDIQVHDTSSASATGLLYHKPNVDVLWTNGLPYLPDLSTSPAPSPSPSASVVP